MTMQEFRGWPALLVTVIGTVFMAASAASQTTYPTRVVTLIVPLQAGTASDLVGRVLAEKVGGKLGKQIVVENITGGGGGVGAQRVAKSEPDGYTLGAFNNGVHTILPHMSTRLQFEPTRDFAPITLLAGFPSVLIVNRDLPATSLKDLIALAKQSPGKLNYASVGVGSPQHIAMEQLKADAGIDMTHVPYRGGAQATQAISTGEVNAFWIATSVALPFIQAGAVRAIAVGERERTKTLPDVPTVAESGLPEYEYSPVLALFAPTGTPSDILSLLHREFTDALRQPDVIKRLQAAGLEPRTSSPAELQKWLQTESVRMAPVVKRVGASDQ
jgi:tripartite-type tricarboxylate transporter receptor subunit TctC